MEENSILSGTISENTGATSPEQVVTGNGEQNPPQTSAVFDYGKMIGENGALSENWKEGLPEAIRGEKCLDSIKTIGTLAQSYVHAQHSMGAGKVALPNEHSTKEEWDSFYKSCGRPETEEGYKTDNVSLPEGIELDESQVASFKKFAFENGLSQKTFEAALAFDMERAKAGRERLVEQHNREFNETLGKLRSEFGGNMDTVVQQCNKAMETFGLTEVFRDKGLLNNYTIIKALAGIGERIGESKLIGGNDTGSGNDPVYRLQEIQGNLDDPYYKKEHPGHRQRVEEVNRLLAAMARSKK